MARRRPLSVVKLGGSAASSPRLHTWLDLLVRCGGRVIVVPGGGAFADAVRTAQKNIGFDDRAAHRMALLAMEQYACALVSLNAGLVPADSVAAMRRVLRRNGTPIWMPSRMVLAASDVPWSWEVTSDSLAVWLAGRVDADCTVLVKQVELREAALQASVLSERRIIDPACGGFMTAVGSDVLIVGPDDCAEAERGLMSGSMVGTRVLSDPSGCIEESRDAAEAFV